MNSGSWWWTGRPGMLQFMGSQRVGHDWVTELDWTLVSGHNAIAHLISYHVNITSIFTGKWKISCYLLCCNGLEQKQKYLWGIPVYGLPQWLSDKEFSCKSGDSSSTPGQGRSPGEGHGNPLQYSCLENPMDGGAWQATDPKRPLLRSQRVRHSWSNLACTHACICKMR